MRRYVYTAWCRDTCISPDDQDHEWPACLIIEAETAEEAFSWGDRPAGAFSERRIDEVCLNLYAVDESEASRDLATLAVVPLGYEASDEEIGW